MQTQSHTSLVTLMACAVLAVFVVAAPAAFADSGTTAPAFPRSVPSQPGAITGADSAARAQERYYTSYSKPAPLSPVSEHADDGGVDWASIGIAIGAAGLLTGAVVALVMRTRRRTGRVHVAA